MDVATIARFAQLAQQAADACHHALHTKHDDDAAAAVAKCIDLCDAVTGAGPDDVATDGIDTE